MTVTVVRTWKNGCNQLFFDEMKERNEREIGIGPDFKTKHTDSHVTLAVYSSMQTQSKPQKCNNEGTPCAKSWDGEKKWAAWNNVIFPCKPRCWYLICSILSSSFKSPPYSIRSQPWPYLNLSLLPVHHIYNANYLNLSVRYPSHPPASYSNLSLKARPC